MKRLIAIVMLGSATGALAYEDAARRADRLRTEQLNRNAEAATTKRDQRSRQIQGRAQADYDQARKRYEQEMADWRRRVASCRAGDYSACDDR